MGQTSTRRIDPKAVAALAAKIGVVAALLVERPELLTSKTGIATLVVLAVASLMQAQTGKAVSTHEIEADVPDTRVQGFTR